MADTEAKVHPLPPEPKEPHADGAPRSFGKMEVKVLELRFEYEGAAPELRELLRVLAQKIASRVLVLCLLSLFGACVQTKRWVRAGTAEQVTQSTLASCSLDAEGRVPFGGDDVARSAHVARLTRLCMQSQGFEQKEEG